MLQVAKNLRQEALQDLKGVEYSEAIDQVLWFLLKGIPDNANATFITVVMGDFADLPQSDSTCCVKRKSDILGLIYIDKHAIKSEEVYCDQRKNCDRKAVK